MKWDILKFIWCRPNDYSHWYPCTLNITKPSTGMTLNAHVEHVLVIIKLLTHWGRATHICVGKITTIGSDNGLSPGRRQAIIWTIAGILLIGPLETNFSEILIGIQTFSFKKMHLKMSSAKWRPSCLGLNVLSNNCTLKSITMFLKIKKCNELNMNAFTNIKWSNTESMHFMIRVY